jgi:hypothetical protein
LNGLDGVSDRHTWSGDLSIQGGLKLMHGFFEAGLSAEGF